jgi:hypothetical protein
MCGDCPDVGGEVAVELQFPAATAQAEEAACDRRQSRNFREPIAARRLILRSGKVLAGLNDARRIRAGHGLLEPLLECTFSLVRRALCGWLGRDRGISTTFLSGGMFHQGTSGLRLAKYKGPARASRALVFSKQ